MIKNKKLLLGLSSLTILLSTATIISCKSSNFKENKEDRITSIVKSNLINKDSIRWILPENVTQDLYITIFKPLHSSTIEGFKIENIKTSNPNNVKGTLKISYDLIRGNQIINVKEYEINGFLTSNQQKINDENFKTILNDLQIKEKNGFIPLVLNLSDKDNDIENEKNKDLANILDRVISPVANKLKNLLTSTSEEQLKFEKPIIYKNMDLEMPSIRFNAHIQKGDVKSSEFTIAIMGLKKQLEADDIKNFISLGFLLNPDANHILPTSINKGNATNYISIDNINIDLWVLGFIGQVQLKIKDIKNQNNEKGSLDIDIDITLNNNLPFNFKTTLYGFKTIAMPIIVSNKSK